MKYETVFTIHDEPGLGYYWILRCCDISVIPWINHKEFSRSDPYFDTVAEATENCAEVFETIPGAAAVRVAYVGKEEPEIVDDVPRLFHAKEKLERADFR